MTAPRNSDHISATEQCSCGASITAEAFSITGVNAILERWRSAHRHDARGHQLATPPPPPGPPPERLGRR